MVDFSLPKLKIAITCDLIEYKIIELSELTMNVSLYQTRDFDEENYLGEFQVELADNIKNPNEWVVNKEFDLEASEYEKDVEGTVALQVKWIPK